MYKNILIATDGTELAQKAVGQGLELARALGAKVTVVTLTAPWANAVSGEMAIAFPVEEYEKSAAANAAQILSPIPALAEKAGVPIETLHVKDQHPAEGIVETAKKIDSDLIVMASHGRQGLSRLLLGGESYKVLTHSNVPVLICR